VFRVALQHNLYARLNAAVRLCFCLSGVPRKTLPSHLPTKASSFSHAPVALGAYAVLTARTPGTGAPIQTQS
jgi:hypothetical protein